MKKNQTPPSTASENQGLIRMIKIMLAALTLVSLAFGGYYTWDRYIHLGDMSPSELGISHQLSLVEQNPNDASARLSLAQSYIEGGNYSEAIRHAEKVLQAFPGHPGALILLGVAYSKQGNASQAVYYLEQFAAVRNKSDDPNMDKVLEAGLYYLGDNYLKTNQPEKAVGVLTEALAIDETDADAMLLLGNAYAQTGKNDEALKSYENTVRFVPDYTEAYSGMEHVYQALNKPANQRYAQGMQAFSQQNYPQARQLLELSQPELSEFAPLYLGLGLTYEKLGDLQAAISSAQRALQLDPKNFAANNLLNRLQTTSSHPAASTNGSTR